MTKVYAKCQNFYKYYFYSICNIFFVFYIDYILVILIIKKGIFLQKIPLISKLEYR